MTSGGFISKILDAIPGYGGYRDRERRRDTDRAIRDKIALDYAQLVDRLGRLATQLAEQRQIVAIGVVDRPHSRLQQFVDRVRTASYGYAPLFANERVDAAALDQLARFDEALADSLEPVQAKIGELESAEPGSADFKRVANELSDLIQRLDDRFDKRHDVIHNAKALPEEDLVRLFEKPTPEGTPRAYRLHEGEAVSYQHTNYTVIGRVSVETAAGSNRAFQLKGGSGNQWLFAAAVHGEQPHWLRRVDLPGDGGAPTLTVEGSSYTLEDQLSGEGEVIGQQGKSGRQPVGYYHYRTADGERHLHVYKLGSGFLALAGAAVDPLELELWTREA